MKPNKQQQQNMRKHLSPAMIVSLIALFFALTGGAVAAQRYIITSPKQIKPSVLTQLRGKTGPKGEQGPSGSKGDAGPAGPMGPSGSKGDAGPAGPMGPSGSKGDAGPGGPMGPSGPQGVAGAPGAQGSQGVPGPGMTLHTYPLPDKTIAPTVIPASDWNSTAELGTDQWTPASWTTVGSAGGYTYSIACGDAKAYAYSSESYRPKYQTVSRGKIQGNDIASEYAGGGSAFAADQYQPVYPSPPSPPGPPTWEFMGTQEWNVDWSGEFASSFSRADGQVVKLWGHIKVTEDACSVSDLKLYVWS
jgi:Collagen triple helix repeat (20 copies)